MSGSAQLSRDHQHLEVELMPELPNCTFNFCFCFDFSCPCGATYRYDADNYHWPTSGNLCVECGLLLPIVKCSATVDKGKMMAKLESLDKIDDPSVFMPRMLGIVHKDCSPWSSQEIEEAYNKSTTKQHLVGSSTPIPCRDSHVFFYPFPGVRITIDDCNVCFGLLKDTDVIIRIPVTLREIKGLTKNRLAGLARDCDCSLTTLARSGCQNPLHK